MKTILQIAFWGTVLAYLISKAPTHEENKAYVKSLHKNKHSMMKHTKYMIYEADGATFKKWYGELNYMDKQFIRSHLSPAQTTMFDKKIDKLIWFK